jgi:hypothetical protein
MSAFTIKPLTLNCIRLHIDQQHDSIFTNTESLKKFHKPSILLPYFFHFKHCLQEYPCNRIYKIVDYGNLVYHTITCTSGQNKFTHFQCWCPSVSSNGNNAPIIRNISSIVRNPFLSVVSMMEPPCEWPLLEVSSGRTCTVATYRNVPALNNIAIPVAFTDERVSLPSCNHKNIMHDISCCSMSCESMIINYILICLIEKDFSPSILFIWTCTQLLPLCYS